MTQQPSAEQPGVAAAIVVRGGRVLMVRRRASEGELSWQFPGGKIEVGETPAQAAVRETREEVGLDVAALRLLGGRVHPKTGRRLTYVACAARTGAAYVAAPDEVAELAWVSHAEIPAYVPYGIFEPVQAYLDAALLG
ncbi:NUDIX hydrolase [Kitasatospora sp. MAP5-34]|uniref:NUDIX hydrolase n=1 Tax=Kitasatospora sp. MAP5-34 TaxID=3035102 RepID=UPI0024730A29|nr:NUDIX hydrolase [Kitasatospora sp. MAP5-34]MDH6580322.1 8-oxo-dGTP diphosphatase [Kitasatospora sp. MAP5-34]